MQLENLFRQSATGKSFHVKDWKILLIWGVGGGYVSVILVIIVVVDPYQSISMLARLRRPLSSAFTPPPPSRPFPTPFCPLWSASVLSPLFLFCPHFHLSLFLSFPTLQVSLSLSSFLSPAFFLPFYHIFIANQQRTSIICPTPLCSTFSSC